MGTKGTAILKALDLTKLAIDRLIRSLLTHEMITSNDETKKKKDLALKASPLENNDDDFEDGEVALLSS